MKFIEIKEKQLEAFENICHQFGTSFTISNNMKWSKFGNYKVWFCSLGHIIKKDWKIVTQHIMSFARESTRQIYAAVYYSLYACNMLKLANHPYPFYASWKDVNPRGYELDHKMPKHHFPELTFNPQNWQALTPKENKAKSSSVRRKEAKEYVLRCNQAFNQSFENLLF